MALGDKTRLRLLDLMADAEVSVGDFTEALGESQPKISRHLAYLRSSGLVNTRRDGKSIYYSIRWPDDPGLFQILRKTLEAMISGSDASLRSHLTHETHITSAEPHIHATYREAHNDLEEFLL